MRNILTFLSINTYVALILLNTTFLSGEEWKKEVLNCGDQICFVLQGDLERMHLGSLMWAKEAVEGGKEMYYDRYFYEGVSLMDKSGDERHIYGPVLEQTGQEWADAFQGVSFTDYVKAKESWDPKFADTIEKENVRYFSDEEREQTLVHWVDGSLWQIGLDNQHNEIEPVEEGVYAFALGNDQLFITPKLMTKKGKIQHSSFFRGGPVRSAGKISVGKDGCILWLSNDSGHYRPEDQEVDEALSFIKSQISEIQLEQIWVRIKSSEAWTPGHPSSIRNYDAPEIDQEHDIPAIQWLQNYRDKYFDLAPPQQW